MNCCVTVSLNIAMKLYTGVPARDIVDEWDKLETSGLCVDGCRKRTVLTQDVNISHC